MSTKVELEIYVVSHLKISHLIQMSQLLYYLFIKPLSLLPLSVLHRLSDGLFFIFFYIIPYRKKVVVQNIKQVFPEKNAKEVNTITRGFYQHFCDVLVEAIKLFSISEKEILERSKVFNTELLTPYFEQGRDVIITAGHHTNWELITASLHPQIKHEAAVIYTPLSNKFFDKKMRVSRGRFGLNLIAKKETKTYFTKERPANAFIFANDQSPSKRQQPYWMEFLNQPTAVQFGTEKYAKTYDCVVVFAQLRKVRRGYYESTLELLEDQANTTDYGHITRLHTKAVERNILEAPQYWLWTHKRWKLKPPHGYTAST